MNINHITSYNQNFQARIKLKAPKLETLLGTSALLGGAASIADSALSVGMVIDPESINASSPTVFNSHESILFSTPESAKIAIPYQTTVFPSCMSLGGSYLSSIGTDYINSERTKK